MKVEVRNYEGEVRSFEDPHEYFEFMWNEGNYACACNRALFFARAGGEPDPHVSCTAVPYAVRISEGGIVVHDEFSEAPQ